MRKYLLAFLLCGAAQAADKDDFYATAFGGARVNHGARPLFVTAVGYCPWDSIGFGVIYDQAFAISSNDNQRNAYGIGGEFRWFLEPFELALSLGYGATRFADGSEDSGVAFSVGAAYLLGIAPSLALRFDIRSELPFGANRPQAQKSVSAGMGLRFLF